ncbi:MAG: PD-(D/E)XK nuclease family protein [Anaerolineae bacterium]|jgi:ATP-dependent helicase/DNAse subunit B|nr:PD-(D/E)XK nuclease family protein [Anaerolineae bacterium]
MACQLLLAPAGHGKTAHCITRIRQIKAETPLAPVWVILPNQQQVSAFRRRLAEMGGAMAVQFGTFYTFYAEIMARAAQPAPRLPDPVQHRLLLFITNDLHRRGRLIHYASLRDKPGFIVALRQLVQELKRAQVWPEDFARAVQGIGPRLEELAAIYAAYQRWLINADWADAEGQGWLAELALEQNTNLACDLRLLVVDGFDEFNPTQLAVLKLLANRAAETIVTLTGELEAGEFRPRIAYRRFARAYQSLTAKLNLSPCSQCPAISNQQPVLYHLQSTLFEPSPQKMPADGAVAFLEATNRSEEVRAALRWIKARLVRDHMLPHQVAVLARDLTPYRPFLEEVAAELGVPLHLTSGLELDSNPAVAALLSLLALPAADWPRRQVLEAWRSPYFDWSAQGIGPGDADWLDAISRRGLVIGGLEQWQEAFDLLSSKKVESTALAEDEEELVAGLPSREETEALRHKFNAFVIRLTPPATGHFRDYVAFVEDLIGDDPKLATRFQSPEDAVGKKSLRVVERAWAADTAPRDIAALRAFKDVLRGLVLAESVLENEIDATAPHPYAHFLQELGGAVEGTRYTLPPPDKSFVLAAPVMDARGLSFRAVALLGLSEGEFPQTEQEDTLLRESDRVWLREQGLPIEPRLRGEEVSLFYQAITRTREKLLLCRPYLADDGQPWEPSPYWEQVRRLIEAPVEHVRPQDSPPIADAASLSELIAALSALPASPTLPASTMPELRDAWKQTWSGAAILRARLAGQSGPYQGDLSPLSPRLAARFDALSGWSASRLESYGTCPFDFFIGHGLELEPRLPPQPGYDVRVLGTMLHRILEEIYRRAHDPADQDELLRLLPAVAGEVFSAAPAEYGFRPTPLWAQQQQELTRILADTLIALADLSKGYIRTYEEQAFGFDGQPPLVISGQENENEIRLHGFIDRIDVDTAGNLRVVDYKISGTSIAARDLIAGRRLQLAIYALAARDALNLGPVSSGFYWHIGKAAPSSLKLEKFEGGLGMALETAIAYVREYVAAIRAGEFTPRPPEGGCPAYCPAMAFCWHYT